MTTALIVAAAVLGVGALAYLVSYNRLVGARQATIDSWAAIDVELDRRHTLIPGLVEAVRATAEHERALLQRLIEVDERAAGADHTPADRSEPEAELARAASAVVALRERYPALNSQQNFLRLQGELAITEDRIGAARRFHNTRVAELNRRVEAFPSNVVADRHGFTRGVFFQA